MKTETKKIAFVSDAVLPFNIGGKEKRLFEVSTRLARKGHDVTVYTMKWWNSDSNEYEVQGVKYKAISPLYPLYDGSVRSMKQGILFALNCFKLLAEDFDVIDVDHMTHLNLYPVKIVCLLKGKKMIATWHEVWGKKYWMNYIGGPKGTVAYIIEKISSFLPNKIISVSEHTEQLLRTVLKTKREIVIIPAGVEVSVDKSITAPQSDIIFAGRLLPNKNVDVLLEAVAILKESKQWIRLVIIGDGPEKQRLEKIAKDLGIEASVEFLGFLENSSELYARMSESKVFAFPSSREGFGMAVIEANACGLPVVTVDSPDNASKFLIKDGQNGLISKLNKVDLASAIKKVLENRGDRSEYIKYTEKYNWDNIVSAIEGEYKKV